MKKIQLIYAGIEYQGCHGLVVHNLEVTLCIKNKFLSSIYVQIYIIEIITFFFCFITE